MSLNGSSFSDEIVQRRGLWKDTLLLNEYWLYRILIANFVEDKKGHHFDSTCCFSKQSEEPLTETKIIAFRVICTALDWFRGIAMIQDDWTPD